MRGPRLAGAALVVVLSGAIPVAPAGARGPSPVLHERIPVDAAEDLAMHVALAGQLPAAIETRSGVVAAPDPARAPSSTDSAYANGRDNSYGADRDTRRPEVAAYDDPFSPSTAPFKRLQAFDSVRADYRLYVADERLVPVAVGGSAGPGDDLFFADLVVNLQPGHGVRIPSVGPGTRVLRATLGSGGDEASVRVARDGAENWFVDSPSARAAGRTRLVMELAIPRAALGGPVADVGWDRLPAVPQLPSNVAQDAAKVRAAIGVGRDVTRPREALAKLVAYFRAFEDSDQPPPRQGSVYLDLALSKKGVCRHRSFAFVVTALSLGIPARFVMNDTHAWVEVSDGTLWRRIDLGGAGHMAQKDRSDDEAPPYDAPADAYPWPSTAERGEDMVREARAGGSSGGRGSSSGSPSSSADAQKAGDPPGAAGSRAVTLSVVDAQPHRGQPLHLSGEVRAEGVPCPHAAVDVWLREAKTPQATHIGTLATGDDGRFDGSIVVPESLALGAYDVLATTKDDRCVSP